jgi:hypothetical protein
MHTLCERYLFLYGRIFVQYVSSRDVREWYWISSVLSLSCRIIVTI